MTSTNDATDQDETDGDGSSGSGDFGRPQLKPDLETLLTPRREPSGAETGHSKPEQEEFGQWVLDRKNLEIKHKTLGKKLALTQLDAPSKITKLIIALGTQTSTDWDVGNLMKALDAAASETFSKSLYQLSAHSTDLASLNWADGTLSQRAQQGHSLHHHI